MEIKNVNEYVVLGIDFVVYDFMDIFGISALKVKNSKVIKVYHEFFKPIKPLSEMVQELSGVTNEMIENNPPFSQAKNDFFKFIENQTIVVDGLYEFTRLDLLKEHGARFGNVIQNMEIVNEKFNNPKIENAEDLANLLKLKTKEIYHNFTSISKLDECLFVMEAFEKLKTL